MERRRVGSWMQEDHANLKGSTLVKNNSKQVEEAQSFSEWVERSVWTDRMLAALASGVKGGKWFALIDKVWRLENLTAAWKQVKSNRGGAGVDRQTLRWFGQNAEKELAKLSRELQAGTYTPLPVRRAWIEKSGSKEKRPLGIPAVRDRVVQTALRNVIEPIFEQSFHRESYGFRPKRGCKDALRKVASLLKDENYWVVDADIKGYFDNIPREQLMDKVREHISDGRVLRLIEAYLEQQVMDGLETWTPEAGTPQGAVISPLLANIYLNQLDHLMDEKGFEMVRYADDFVILCKTREEAEEALAVVTQWITEAGLTLHPIKTKIVNEDTDGFEFLGYLFKGGKRFPRDKSLRKLKDSIRSKTHRRNGNSMGEIIKSLNSTLRGWYNYFKHSYKTVFQGVDGWIRRRLRSILVLRTQGISRWRFTHEDHKRWPNAFFHALGLFSLELTFVAECQSRKST